MVGLQCTVCACMLHRIRCRHAAMPYFVILALQARARRCKPRQTSNAGIGNAQLSHFRTLLSILYFSVKSKETSPMHLNALGAAFDARFSKASLQTRCTAGCTVYRRPHTPSMSKYTSDGLQHRTVGISVGELASSHRWFCAWRMAHGWRVGMGDRKALLRPARCIVGALHQVPEAYIRCAHVPGLQHCTMPHFGAFWRHFGGDMIVESPARTHGVR